MYALCLSLLYFINVTSSIIYILFHKTVVSFITQCITRPLKKVMMAKCLEAIDHIYNSI